MMAVLSVAFSVLAVTEERSGSLRLTVRLAPSDAPPSRACSLVSGLLQSCSPRLPSSPRGGSGAAAGGLPSSARTPLVLWEGRTKRCKKISGKQ